MKSDREAYCANRARVYFSEIEARLTALNVLFEASCSAMQSLVDQYRRSVTRCALVLYFKPRQGDRCELYWSTIPRRRPRVGDSVFPAAPNRPRRVRHVAGDLSREFVRKLVKDSGLVEGIMEFDRRARELNEARGRVVNARQAIEQMLNTRAIPRAWEAGDLHEPVPLLAAPLPASSKRALGSAWAICLRMAAVDFEIDAVAQRHNASPPHPPLLLIVDRDVGHPYGRSCWTLNGDRILGHAQALATGGRPVADPAALTDRVMRKLQIPAKARRAIAPHEAQRRRMEERHRQYVGIFSRLRSKSGKAVALADRSLDAAKPPVVRRRSGADASQALLPLFEHAGGPLMADLSLASSSGPEAIRRPAARGGGAHRAATDLVGAPQPLDDRIGEVLMPGSVTAQDPYRNLLVEADQLLDLIARD